LLRVLGLGFGIAVTLGNTIGAGIMSRPGDIAGRLPASTLIIAAWIAGGLYSLLGCFAMAELGAMIPRSGGYYMLTRRAYPEHLAFAVGWTDWMALCASGALVGILASQYASHLLPRLHGHEALVGPCSCLSFRPGAVAQCALGWLGTKNH
jgi:APA family basic amino acid/polyamine antiporter